MYNVIVLTKTGEEYTEQYDRYDTACTHVSKFACDGYKKKDIDIKPEQIARVSLKEVK